MPGQRPSFPISPTAVWFLAAAGSVSVASASVPLQGLSDGNIDGQVTSGWYDLRPLASLSTSGLRGVDMRLHVSTARIDNLEPDGWDVPISVQEDVSLDECISSVERAVSADPNAELEEVRLFRGRLQVIGNAAAQAIAKRTVASLHALSSESVQVDVLRIGAERLPEGAGPILSPEETVLLFERAAGIPQLSQDMALGRRTILGQENSTSFVADYDVEVAQGAMVPDATISILRTGLSLGLRVDRAADDRRLVVRVWGRDGDMVTPMASIAQGGFADAPIELPAVRSGIFAASGLIEPGGAIVLNHGGGKTGTMVLRIKAGERSAGYPSETIILGEHMLGDMRVNPMTLPQSAPSGGWGREENDLALETAPWSEDGVGARGFVDEVLDLPRLADSLVPFGSRALYVGADDERSQLRESFTEYAKTAPRHTFSVMAAYARVSAEEAAALRLSGDYASFAKAADNQLGGAVLEGDTLLLVGGTESSYLQDYDVQIAQGAAIADPIIWTTFEGMGFWCSPVAASDGGMQAWFDITYHAPGSGERTMPIANYHANVGDASKDHALATGRYKLDLEVQLRETKRAATRALITLDEKDWRLVTAQPIAGTDDVLVMVAKAAAQK